MSDPGNVHLGPLPGEQFSQTVRRLARELYGAPLDAEPAKDMPGRRVSEMSYEEKLRLIWRPREPGQDDGDEAV